MARTNSKKMLVEEALRKGEKAQDIAVRLQLSKGYVQNVKHYLKAEGTLTALAAEVMGCTNSENDASDEKAKPLSDKKNREAKAEPSPDTALVDHIFALYDKKLLSQQETVTLIKRGAIA